MGYENVGCQPFHEALRVKISLKETFLKTLASGFLSATCIEF